MGVPIARCELLDAHAVRAVNRHDKLTLRRSADAADGVPRQRRPASPSRPRRCRRSPSEHGGEGFEWATTPEERTQAVDGAAPRLFRRPADEARLPHRHHRHLRADLAPGRMLIEGRRTKPTPPACRTTSSATSATATSTSPIWSTRAMPERARAGRAAERAAGAARAGDGRHLHRRARHRPAQDGLPVSEAGAGAVDMMRTVKRALDPKNIMNPGKIFAL